MGGFSRKSRHRVSTASICRWKYVDLTFLDIACNSGLWGPSSEVAIPMVEKRWGIFDTISCNTSHGYDGDFDAGYFHTWTLRDLMLTTLVLLTISSSFQTSVSGSDLSFGRKNFCSVHILTRSDLLSRAHAHSPSRVSNESNIVIRSSPINADNQR
jgi:hypothetical protein